MLTLSEAETLVAKLRAEERAEIEHKADEVRQRYADAAAAKQAEEARLLRKWEAEQKNCRIRIIVPDGIGTPSIIYCHGRNHTNHLGETVLNCDVVVGAVEDGVRVCYLQSWHDFRTFLTGPQGLAWHRANPEAVQRMPAAEIGLQGLRR